RKMQEQLAEATRLSSLGRIATSIAHEFNNVLMGMQANLEVVRRRAPVQLEKTVNHILNSVLRGKRITDEILGFTRGTAPSIQDVPLATFIARWEETIRPVLGASIALKLDVTPGLLMRADTMQISQVLTNLALNARDAMPNGGTLHVIVDQGAANTARSADGGSFVHLSVRDDGVGMPADVLQHIFEPLFTTKHSGTGLGLAVTYQIISRHGGFITAESTPGRGTTFDLLLPAAEPQVQTPDVVAAATPAGRSVVIVDDDETVLAGLQSLLEFDQMRVAVATLGGEAIPLITRESPDVVILDIGLPDMSGVDVYELIAERWPTLPVLFSSGHADAARLEPLLRRPNVALLLKPYDYVALQRMLAFLVDGNSGSHGSGHTRPDLLPVM
ncbi:MAG TPA: ATP-binding protein, partial [Thermoanaerobaculia bacterium]